MDPDAERLLELARAVALEIPEARAARVLENFQRIEQLAQSLDDVALAPEDELGPEWKP